MRSLLVIAAALALSACATQTPAPAASMPAPAPAAAKKAPQCWNGDLGKFQDVGTKTMLSGVAVECKPTSDGKAAQWMGTKH
jgi:uncharacterized lipoprotein YmbA